MRLRHLLSTSTIFSSHPRPYRTLARLMSTRTYAEAIERLNSLQSNAATLDAVRASGGRLSEFAIPEMIEYWERMGYKTTDLNRLNVIHVTGTKGKGSTCAFVSSVLTKLKPESKFGLYTSPHLVAVRERIRVNGTPLSEEHFAKYFFEVWDRLDANTTRKHESTPVKPNYFRFVTLIAYHALLDMKVDATILEVGVGGRYDSTNIVPRPIVTGITALGIDHVGVLGKTLPEIAWQKAGIYKADVPALTVEQPEEALRVLREQATEVKASKFEVVPVASEVTTARLGLAGAHQIQNASLAVALVKEYVRETSGSPLEDTMLPTIMTGLEAAKWPGRCQTVQDPSHNPTRWYLDGAHTLESLDCCMAWFVKPGLGLPIDATTQSRKRVLIFNCTSGRTGSSFLELIRDQVTSRSATHGHEVHGRTLFDCVMFCTNVTYADGNFKGDLTTRSIHESDLAQLTTQRDLASAWKELVPDFPAESILVLPSIEHAVRQVRDLGGEPVDVLVTGSLHLVGGVIEVAGLSDVAL